MTAPPGALGSGPAMVRCLGCHGLVQELDGPTHAYMKASPGCWAVHGQLVARAASGLASPVTRWHHVDCYAVQHPGGAEHDRRQRQSVAVHLTALCLLLEHHLPARRAASVRGRMSQTVLRAVGLPDWPHLSPPAELGGITAAQVQAAPDPDQLADQLHAWAQECWTAWAEHHRTVRTWADAALGGQG